MSNPTISLCMIVKDEEALLANCLESIEDFVDEIIVMDTGSRDDTVKIARQYTPNIYFFDWNNNFSDARNASLDHASKEWILLLDADEVVPFETASKLKDLAKDPSTEAWTFTIVNPVSQDSANSKTKHINLRMFRNRPKYRFSGEIHEQIDILVMEEKARETIGYSGLEIIHYGYINDPIRKKRKNQRNLSILKEQFQLNPKDSFTNFNLGTSYLAAKELLNAKKHFEIAVTELNSIGSTISKSFSSVLHRNYSMCLAELGDYKEALDILDHSISLYPDYPDLYFLKGQIYYEIGLLEESKQYFLKCTHFKNTPPEYTSMVGLTSYMSYENLGYIYEMENGLENAIHYFTLAFKENHSASVLLHLCTILKNTGYTEDEISESLESNFSSASSSSEVYHILGLAHSQLHSYTKAFSLFLEAANRSPNDKKDQWNALEQLLNQKGLFIQKSLAFAPSLSFLREELIELYSLKKKISLAKEVDCHER